MGNLKTAHVRPSVGHHISEMPGWIHLKFYSMITYIPRVMPVFSDFEKIVNWRFYGRFSSFFQTVLNLGSVFSVLYLGHGCLDSYDTSQNDQIHLRDDCYSFRIIKRIYLEILWLFFILWIELRFCASKLRTQVWLGGFIWYFTAWWPISQGW